MTATLSQPTTTTTTTPAAARPSAQTRALAATRVVVSFLFVCHGLQGLFGAFGGVDGQGTAVPFGVWPYWWVGVIHVVAGGLVGIGLCTRTAALLCSGAMAYGYFVVHQPTGLLPLTNGGEPAALYSWIFLLIAVAGPGAYALDRLRKRG